jgi:hypothetical protein
MRNSNNLARLPFNNPQLKDGDGEDGDVDLLQVTIDMAENGYVLTVLTDTVLTKVFLFDGNGQDGPQGMLQQIIESLGLLGKVRLEK